MSPSAVPVQLAFEHEGAPSFHVEECHATYAISELFDIRVVALSTDTGEGLQDLIRAPVTIAFEREPHVPVVRGVVRRARILRIEPSGMSRWELRIAPPAWILGKRLNHRIFADATTLEIAQALLGEHGCPLLDASRDGRPRREYTVQYGETDLHAMLRLLADDGYVLLPRLDTGSFKATLDTTAEHFPLPQQVPYRDASALSPGALALYDAGISRRARIARGIVGDYDADNPNYRVEGAYEGTDARGPATYRFEVGAVRTAEDAVLRAKAMLRSEHRPSVLFHCGSTSALAPGTQLTMIDHPLRAEPYEIIVIESRSAWVRAAGGETTVRHELVCQTATKPRAAGWLPKPRIAGVQTARVVGAPGSEIDVDEQGRVQVEHHWDRRRLGKLGASRRIRVSQGWAGVGHGFVTLPRVGDEVVVAYLDGDPDEPLIVGSVHNPTRPNPLSLPAEKTMSVWRSRSSPGGDGFNEIRFDDAAGAERFTMHAERDMQTVVERDATKVVRKDETRRVGGDYTSHTKGTGDLKFDAGFDLSTKATGTIAAKDLQVNAGTETHKVDGQLLTNAGSIYTMAKGDLTLTAATIAVLGDSSIRLQVGASTITITSGEIAIRSSKVTVSATGDCEIVGAPIKLNC